MNEKITPNIEQHTTVGTVQRWTAVAAVALTPLVVGPPSALDGIMVSKAFVVHGVAIVALSAAMAAVGRSARVLLPRDPAIVAAAAFIGLFIVATALSPNVAQSIAGILPRWTGLGLYLACAVLFVVAAARFTSDYATLVIRAVVVASALLGVLAIAESLGIHSFGGADVSGAKATLGNPNFLAGWLAVAVPLGATLALERGEITSWRLVGAGAALLALVGSIVTRSAQGPLAAAAAIGVLALVWMSPHVRRSQVRMAAILMATAGGLALVVAVAGFQGNGPLGSLADTPGIEHRGYYWSAAVSMVSDEPLTGIGPAQFEANYRRHRPVEDALQSPVEDTTDAAHSVPLELAAAGGVPLVLAYGAWGALVAWRLWRGLATLEGRSRLLLGGVGAAWLAYVLQSLVSVDVPPLAVLGWVLGGLIVALSVEAPPWCVELPWKPARRGRRGANKQPTWLIDGAVALVAVGLMWVSLLPIRADAGAGEAAVTASGALDPSSGVAQAANLAGWEPAYGMHEVRTQVNIQDVVNAQHAAVALAQRHSQSLDAVMTAARLSVDGEDLSTAERLYRRALVLEPIHPDVAVEVARFALKRGDRAWASELVEGVLELTPAHPAAQKLQRRL